MGCDYWVAPGGSDTAAGTEAAPFATFQRGYDALCPPPTGASGKVACASTGPNWTLCFKSGTYNFTASMWIKSTRGGTSAKQLRIIAAPNATTRPILDFTGQPRLAAGADPENTDRGIKINADYALVKGFEVRKANDNGIHIQGANDVVENCVVHDNDDTGIQIGTDVVGSSGMNNTVRNCDSYRNYDAANGGENADGFGMKESSGTGNRFEGCRAWENADDGYDFYAWVGTVTLTNCWAYRSARNGSFTGVGLGRQRVQAGRRQHGRQPPAHDVQRLGQQGARVHEQQRLELDLQRVHLVRQRHTGDTGVSGISTSGCPTTRTGARNIDGTIP